MKTLRQIRLSQLYWCFGCLFSLGLILGYEIHHKISWFFMAVLVFVVTLFISHSEKVANSLDYEEEEKK